MAAWTDSLPAVETTGDRQRARRALARASDIILRQIAPLETLGFIECMTATIRLDTIAEKLKKRGYRG